METEDWPSKTSIWTSSLIKAESLIPYAQTALTKLPEERLGAMRRATLASSRIFFDRLSVESVSPSLDAVTRTFLVGDAGLRCAWGPMKRSFPLLRSAVPFLTAGRKAPVDDVTHPQDGNPTPWRHPPRAWRTPEGCASKHKYINPGDSP